MRYLIKMKKGQRTAKRYPNALLKKKVKHIFELIINMVFQYFKSINAYHI